MTGYIFLILSLFSLYFSSAVAASENALTYKEKRILFIYSYHPTFPTSLKVIKGFRSEFGTEQPIIEVEFMDSKRNFDSKSTQLFLQTLTHKLENRPPYDTIVTIDDNAFSFALEHKETLFPDLPIVFLGVNDLIKAKKMDHRENITGVVENASLKENIALAKTLFPKMQTLYVIADDTPSGQSDLQTTQALFNQFPTLQFEVIDLSQLSWEALSSKLSNLPKGQVILLLSAYRDVENNGLSFSDSLALIVNSSFLPIIHPYEHGLGEGVFGGVIVSHFEQGRQAAIKVKAILDGEPISDIPILHESPNIFTLDKRQMDRFGIPTSILSNEANVLFYSESTISKYWKELMVFGIIFLLLNLIIIILIQKNRAKAKFSRDLYENERRLKLILDNITSAVYMKNALGKYLFTNRAMLEKLDCKEEEVIGKSDTEIFNNDRAISRHHTDKEVLRKKQIYRKIERFENPKTLMLQELSAVKIPLLNEDGDVYGLCSVSTDVTDQMAYERQLQQIAHYDQLTKLPNRVLFSDRLKQAMKLATRQKSSISVLYMDLDGFKEVNDTFGHEFGDQLLQVFASRVKALIRNNDTAARLGGDEFVVLLINSGKPEDDFEITHKLLERASSPITINDISVTISASVGITRYPQQEQTDADQLIRQADQAMYTAKKSGKNQFHYFNAELEEQAVKQEELFNEVRRALKRGEFLLFYQPKVDLDTGAVVGLEALVRWAHPTNGILPPAAFLPNIEKHSLMIEIDHWVVGQALLQLSEWQKQGIHVPISVNVSHMYFQQENLPKVLQAAFAAHPSVPTNLLEIEVIESQALENLSQVANTISECQTFGVQFALDDFGTGYSSLTYLKQLPINMLKVDRSFVINMLEDQEDRSILEGILALSKAFGIKATAEGLETIEHGIQLKAMGYQFAQGYGIAKPMPPADLPNWIANWKAPQAWQQ